MTECLLDAGIMLDLELELPPAPGSLELPPDVEVPETIHAKKGKRTYQPNRLKRKRTHGFLQCARQPHAQRYSMIDMSLALFAGA